MRIKLTKSGKEWFLLILFYLLLLQRPLEDVHSLFRYIDELLPLLGPAIYVYRVIKTGKIVLKKENTKVISALFFFVLLGLMGNLIFGYQIGSAVLEDLYVNLKFFLAIMTGYELFFLCKPENCKRVFQLQAKNSAFVFFVLLLIDLIFHVFKHGGTRYGLRVVQLFYGYPSYLAGSMVFLLATLALYYEKKSDLFLLMACLVQLFTLRGKAIAGVAIFFLVYFFVLKQQKKLRFWHILLFAAVALVVGWEQYAYYFIDLRGTSARSALTQTSFVIAKEYFPIGTGFGTYASNVAAEYYSPVYRMYGLSSVHGLTKADTTFGSDTFWPIIIGQNGIFGTICYAYVLITLFMKVLRMKSSNINAHASGIFLFGYLMISSTSEATFCNSISIPLALVLGFILAMDKKQPAGSVPQPDRGRQTLACG